jgi:hypothetical protein
MSEAVGPKVKGFISKYLQKSLQICSFSKSRNVCLILPPVSKILPRTLRNRMSASIKIGVKTTHGFVISWGSVSNVEFPEEEGGWIVS